MDSKTVSNRIQTQTQGYLSEYSGQSEPHKNVLSGPRTDSPVLYEAMNQIDSGTCSLHDLGRAYKHTPHAPPGVFFKYLVHRVNNLDEYDAPAKAKKLDDEFMQTIAAGGAQEQNYLVTPRHLHSWLNLNPHLVEQALDNQKEIQAKLIASNASFKTINGEPYVAMTRGLDQSVMTKEMPLSSFADKPDTGFGAVMHHIWMPVKDLWYSFPFAPQPSWGEHGHENEWLFSDKNQRYFARGTDVKPHNQPEPQPSNPTPPEQLKGNLKPTVESFLATALDAGFNESVGAHMVEMAQNNTKLLPIIAEGKAPCLALHRYLISALDAGPTGNVLPAKLVSDCFWRTRLPESSQAFNNSQNTERYMRALADYFGNKEDTEDALNVYQRILFSARMSDTLLSVITDLANTHKTIPGINSTQLKGVVQEMARWNEHLTQRQLLRLATVPEAALGLLHRDSPITEVVQEEIAKNAEEQDLLRLAAREDLGPKVAEQLLKRMIHWGNPTLGVTSIACNPRIPVELLKKHINENAPLRFVRAIELGLRERSQNPLSIVQNLPVGGTQ